MEHTKKFANLKRIIHENSLIKSFTNPQPLSSQAQKR